MMRSKVKQARESVEALRLAMVSSAPVEIGTIVAGLEEAGRCLATIEQDVREGACAPYEVRRELKMLKNDLRISGRLIEHGLAFCQGWARMTGAGPAYTQAGRPAVSPSEGTLSFEG
jgi:hypothetical protein